MSFQPLILSTVVASVLIAATPMVPGSMSTDNGGTKSAIDAYSDGAGVVIINQASDTKFDNSAMNGLVFKYGESAKTSNTTLKNEVKIISSTSTPEEKLLADKIGLTTPNIIDPGVEAPVEKSCKEILLAGKSTGSGVYSIDVDGAGSKTRFDVYCDMETDGGGWTAATMLADETTRNLFYTSNTTKISSLTSNIGTKGQLSDIWIDSASKDILVRGWSSDIVTNTNYTKGFILYAFSKNDITNLTKQNKQNTMFSTGNITAKNLRNNVSTVLKNVYSASGSETSHYLLDEVSSKYFFDLYLCNGFYYRGIGTESAGGMADYPGVSGVIPFNTANYMVTFIR